MNKDQINTNLFSLNPLPSWISDNETLEILDVNIAALDHYGYSRKEFLSLTLKDLRPPEEVSNLIKANKSIKKREGNIYLGIFKHQKKNGSLIQMEINGHRVDINDRPCLLVVCQDVTEKIKQEEKILQSEQRFKALVQEGGDMISIIDSNGKYSYTSPTTTTILGISPEEFEGKTIFDFIHPDDIERALSYMQRISTESKVVVEPFRLRDGKNEWRWIETILTNMLDNPAVNGIVANSRDITEWVNAREQLKANEQFNRTVLESSPDCLKVLDSEGRIQFMNFKGLCQMEIDDFSDYKDKNWWTLWGSENENLVKEAIDKALKGENVQFVAFCPTAKGTPKWWDVMVSPVGKTGEAVKQIISVSRDITQQKQKEFEKELLGKISLNFSVENDLLSASTALCKTICEYGSFDFVELWLPNIENTHIQLYANISATSHAETFYEWSKDIHTFKPGEGLPGAIWNKKSKLIWEDISKKDDFVRKESAQKAGIESILGIPLRVTEEIVGVLIMATQWDLSYLKKHSKLFEKFEHFIGSEINRKKLENDLSHLYNAVPDILCLADFKGRFLKMNKAGCELLEYSENEIIYHTFDEFVHPDDKDISTNEVNKLSEGITPVIYENRYLTKSGKVIWLNWTCNSAVNEGLIYATAKNITEEKKLRELNRQTRDLAKVGGWEYDLVEQSLFWSDEAHRLHETDPITFVPHIDRSIEFYKDEHKSFVEDQIHKSLNEGVYLDYEAIIITKSKKERWVRVIGNPEYIEGKCVKLIGCFQDITDRKEAEVRLQILSDNIPGVVYQYLLFPYGTDQLRYVSKGVEKIWGYSSEAVTENIDLVKDQIKAGGDFEAVKESLKTSIEKRSKWYSRFRTISPDGEKRILQGLGTPEFLPNGTVLFNSVVLDVTQEAKNEKILAQATEIAKIGSWEVDLINSKAYWSEMTHQIHETDANSYIPNLTDAIHFFREDFRPMINSLIEKSTTTGESFDLEAVLVTANKNERWIRAIGNAEMVDGKCERLFGSFQDINERKQSELAIFESEARFRTILEAEPQCIKLLGPDGELLMMNPAGLAMIEADNEEQILGKSVLGIILPEHRSSFSELTQSVFEGASGKLVFEMEGFKGTRRWMETHAVPLKNEQGDIISLLGVTRDITESRQSEEAIKDSEEKRRLIMTGALDAIICIDIHEKITFWNPQAEVIFGWKEAEVMGQSLSELIVPEPFRKYHNEGIKHYLKTGEGKALNVLLELSAINQSGEEFPIELTVIPIKQGEDVFFCAFIRDISERKKSEAGIRDSEEKRRLIMNSALDAIICMDLKGNVTFWNPQAEKIFGWSQSEVMHQRLSDYIIPEDLRSMHNTGMNHYVKTGEAKIFNRIEEFSAVNKNGEIFPVELTVIPIKQGNEEFFCSFIRDISKRKKAEEELRNAFEEKNNILESIGDGFFAVDKNWSITYWNKEAELILGRMREEIVGKNLWEIYADAADTDFYRQCYKVIETGESISLEDYFATLNKWFEVSLYPTKEGLSAYFKDITLRKEADIRLIQANERFEKVTAATNDAIWDYDVVNNHLFWGRGFHTLFGYNLDEIEPSFDSLISFIHENDRERITTNVMRYMQDVKLENWYEEYRFMRADGTFAFVIDRAIFIRNNQDKVVRVIGAMTDISEQMSQHEQLLGLHESLQNYAKELERSNEELEKFAYITSHDLQEPLRMITGFMDQLKRKYGDQLDEKALQYIHFASDGAKRMKHIILDLLQYSRAGQAIELMEDVDLNDLLSDFKQLRRKVISEKNVTITYSHLPSLNTHRAGIVQVFHSLLDNAIKYSKEGIEPHIEINVVENKDEWKFTVKDNGIGIAPESFDKIFIIFQRLHSQIDYDGTGIGLSIAKKHVEFLGGKIWLESKLGEGTTFYFTVSKSRL